MLLKITPAVAALAAATALAGAASAQDQSNYAGSTANPTGSVQTDANGSASASATTPASANGYNVGAPQVDPNTGAQIVTNGPVPDTRANRARFGQPDSHAGRRTAPAGN